MSEDGKRSQGKQENEVCLARDFLLVVAKTDSGTSGSDVLLRSSGHRMTMGEVSKNAGDPKAGERAAAPGRRRSLLRNNFSGLNDGDGEFQRGQTSSGTSLSVETAADTTAQREQCGEQDFLWPQVRKGKGQ